MALGGVTAACRGIVLPSGHRNGRRWAAKAGYRDACAGDDAFVLAALWMAGGAIASEWRAIGGESDQFLGSVQGLLLV